MRHTRLAPLALAAITLLAAACAPTATTGAGARVGAAALDAPCASDPPPTVAIVDFASTTAAHGTTIVGVEEAATARLITLMKASGCYVVVERSELVRIMEQQGLESMDPVELARAAGAGYVVTGTVTRGTIARPGASILGVTLGETRADVEVDVRATDIITGEVVVSMTGAGSASSPNVAVSRIPVVGYISFDDPTVGPLLAEAAEQAIERVVSALRAAF